MTKLFGFGIERESIPVIRERNTWKPVTFSDLSQTNAFQDDVRLGGDFGLKVGRKVVASFHDDGTVEGIELQAGRSGSHSDWKHRTIKEAVAQLQLAEKSVIKKITHVSDNDKKCIFPFGTVGEKITAGSSRSHGSLHLTITLPTTEEELLSHYRERWKEFGRQLQWVEPLLLSKIGGARMNSVNDAGANTEGSERIAHNDYGGMLGDDLSELFNSTNTDMRAWGESDWWRNKVSRSMLIKRNVDGSDLVNKSSGKAGVEIRFSDTFDSRFAFDYCKFLALLSVNKGDSDNSAHGNEFAGEAAARVLEEGFNAYVPAEYVSVLEKSLDLTFTEKEKKVRRASDLMDIVVKKVFEKNKSSADAKLLIGESTILEPHLFDVNRASFFYVFRKKLREDLTLESNLEELLTGLLDVKGKGNISGESFRELLDKTAGRNLSLEDTRDTIDFLEYHKLLSVTRNPDGSIDSVKLEYSSSDEVSGKLKAITNDISFYSGEVEEPFFDSYKSDTLLLSEAGVTAADLDVSRMTIDELNEVGSSSHVALVQQIQTLQASITAFVVGRYYSEETKTKARELLEMIDEMRDESDSRDWRGAPFSVLTRVYNNVKLKFEELQSREVTRLQTQRINLDALTLAERKKFAKLYNKISQLETSFSENAPRFETQGVSDYYNRKFRDLRARFMEFQNVFHNIDYATCFTNYWDIKDKLYLLIKESHAGLWTPIRKNDKPVRVKSYRRGK